MKRSRQSTPTQGIKDMDALVEAIRNIHIHIKSVRYTAAKYGIPFKSLSRYMRKVIDKISDVGEATNDDIKQVLTEITARGPPTVRE